VLDDHLTARGVSTKRQLSAVHRFVASPHQHRDDVRMSGRQGSLTEYELRTEVERGFAPSSEHMAIDDRGALTRVDEHELAIALMDDVTVFAGHTRAE
jgi:hypothetical protein